MRRLLAALLLLAGLVAPALAVTPDEMLKDPTQEARARTLSAELRCLVCQNQSIDDSEAPLAHDLRVLLRERITAGDNDEAVKNYLVARYGEFILLKPRFELQTAILWLTPILVLVLGGLGILFARRAIRPTEPPLSAEEKAELDRILAKPN